MTRLGWITDPHLVFLRDPEMRVFDPEFDAFLDEIRRARLDRLLISGDISEAPELVEHLERLDDALELPIDFVLGNHDFYRSSFAAVRAQVAELTARRSRLGYLSARGAVEIANGVGLVGHDGFGDGRYGLYHFSDLTMNDDVYIEDLKVLDRDARLPLRKRLGDEAAAHLRRVLSPALEEYSQVIVLTHFPPFAEAALRRGKPCEYDALPFYACGAMGDVLLDAAREHPQRQILVLCGHTHERCEYSPCANLQVSTGAAEYGSPRLERVWDV
jgi:predicted phosphohydrolase